MAVVDTAQKVAIAQGFVQAASDLTKAWSTIQKYKQLFSIGGYSFQAGDFDSYPPLQFIDPTTMGTIITELDMFVTWLNANGGALWTVTPANQAQI